MKNIWNIIEKNFTTILSIIWLIVIGFVLYQGFNSAKRIRKEKIEETKLNMELGAYLMRSIMIHNHLANNRQIDSIYTIESAKMIDKVYYKK